MIKKISIITTLSLLPLSSHADDLQSLLEQGKWQEAQTQFANQNNNQGKFTSAICQLGLSIEKFQQGLYHYGFGVTSRTAGIRHLAPIPENPTPTPVDYTKIRKLLETLHQDLQGIETTLATLDDSDFYLPLDLTKARFDVDNDGKYTELESSLALFLRLQQSANGGVLQTHEDTDDTEQLDATIGFDKSDLLWLKGYIQVSLAMTDILLAHDFSQPFDAISGSLFKQTTNTHHSIFEETVEYDDIADFIAAIHLTKMPIIEPDRLKQARIHLLSMVTYSQEMWQSILAETDDSKEWIPSPKQNSITGIQITQPMINDWHLFLDEYKAILEGNKLLPHWRFKNKGINLKRVLEESTETDIILWATGHAAAPFIEKGDITKDDLWRQLNRTFNNNFFGMSFFIN